jgi:hypothetical protein
VFFRFAKKHINNGTLAASGKNNQKINLRNAEIYCKNTLDIVYIMVYTV